MIDLVVRAAGAGDLLAVLGVHARRDPGGDLPERASDVEQRTWDRVTQSEELTVYLAESGGEPVGTATLMLMPNLTYACAPTAFVEAVVVAAEHRRQGVGSAMLRQLLADARSSGCNKVQLLSHKRHATDGAHHLYSSLGFEPEAEGFRLYLQQPPAAAETARAER